MKVGFGEDGWVVMEVGALINPNSYCSGCVGLIVRWGVPKLMMSFLVIFI